MAKEVSQLRGARRGVRGCLAFLPFFNTKIIVDTPHVFLYSDSLRKRYKAHCYGEWGACIALRGRSAWLSDSSMDTHES